MKAHLRARVPAALRFGDEASLTRYLESVHVARARAGAPPYQVAPRCTIVSSRGVLTGGEEVRFPEDLTDGDVSPTVRLHRLIDKGLVLVRADVEDEGPEAA